MLVLTRKIQESVVIGGCDGSERTLKVTVLDIRGWKVKLGFEAAAGVLVHRWEVWQRMQANGRPDGEPEPAIAAVPE